MDVQRFIQERRPGWSRLERLLEQAEASPDWELGKDRLHELLQLYRQASSDLNQARSKTGNPELLGRLNDLVGRGYRFVYRRRHGERMLRALGRFFRYQVPRTFRLESAAILTASGAFLLGTLFGFAAVIVNPVNGERLIPREFYTESPRERVERIEREEERIDTTEKAMHFGVSLYTHNIQVSFLAFSLGATTILGGIWILFLNGVILGAVFATYTLDGVTTFFFAWVGPHGALELPAIVFGGAAGLRAGQALLLPGDRSRASSLRRVFPAVWRMMAAAAAVLVLAGLIEGSFSQFSAKTVPYPLKIGVAVILFGSLLTYLFFRRLPEEGV
ncbi:MAG TPA: stage II sporulation protein M [Vicinamibacteria bacterium]|nr:stage II sporulation protein M [Vicinamibacteria bacterium]